MKFLIISYSEALDSKVMEALETAGIEGYTKWTKVLGKGKTSGPHLGTHVWPKANNVIGVAVEPGQANRLLESIRELRRTLGHEGVKAFELPLEEIT